MDLAGLLLQLLLSNVFHLIEENHKGWIFFTNVAQVHLILKSRINSFNICLLKSNESCFVWYLNCWKHLNFRLSKFPYQLSLHNLFKFLSQRIAISVIAMTHLDLFFFTLNLTDRCPDYLSVRSLVVQKPANWFVVQIIWLVFVWCRILPGGISEQIFVV